MITNREAAIISAYTGVSFGGKHFNHLHQYIEEKFGRPVWTHEMGSESFWSKLKELCTEDFLEMGRQFDE